MEYLNLPDEIDLKFVSDEAKKMNIEIKIEDDVAVFNNTEEAFKMLSYLKNYYASNQGINEIH